MSLKRWLPLVSAVVALGALVLAAPAAGISVTGGSSAINSCSSGGSGSGDGDGVSDGGSCNQQSRSVRQSAGGDASFSITQRQSFDDDDRVRISRSRSRHRDHDDEERDELDVANVSSAERDVLDCRDFSSQAEAQEELDGDANDPNRLDSDDDGRACEETFTQFVRGTPEEGVETGGGGTLAPRLAAGTDASPGAAAEVARTLGPAVALGLILAGIVGLRRARTH